MTNRDKYGVQNLELVLDKDSTRSCLYYYTKDKKMALVSILKTEDIINNLNSWLDAEYDEKDLYYTYDPLDI